jgi:hypothetical protein
MGSDMDSSLKTSLSGVANLVDHANKLAKRSVQAAKAGNPESALDLALEVERCWTKQLASSMLPSLSASRDKRFWTVVELERTQSETNPVHANT